MLRYFTGCQMTQPNVKLFWSNKQSPCPPVFASRWKRRGNPCFGCCTPEIPFPGKGDFGKHGDSGIKHGDDNLLSRVDSSVKPLNDEWHNILFSFFEANYTFLLLYKKSVIEKLFPKISHGLVQITASVLTALLAQGIFIKGDV